MKNEETKSNKTRRTLYLEKDIWQRFKGAVALSNESLTGALEKLLNRYVDEVLSKEKSKKDN